MRIPIADSHSHSNPARGLGAGAIASKFREENVWFMALLSLPPWSYGLEFEGLESYRRVIDLHVGECRRAAASGIRVSCFSGFHPADVDKLIDRYRLRPEKVLGMAREVIGLLRRYCREGLLDGIGEVGRQHYKTRPERVSLAEVVMVESVEAARDEGCLVQLHLEQSGEATVYTVDYLLGMKGLRGYRGVIFHHATTAVALNAWKRGYTPTIPGIPELLKHAYTTLDPFFLVESDFIDDPKRPGAVMYPWLIRESVSSVLKESRSPDLEERVYKTMIDNVVRVFGVEPP